MKKIIGLIACAMVAVTTAFGAGLCGDVEKETGCQQWFKITAPGKISRGTAGGAYKTVQTLKIKNCYLVYGVDGTVLHLDGVKGKDKFQRDVPCTEFQWNVFGKKIDKVLDGETSKSQTLESEIYFKAEDDGVSVSGVLFGKVTAKATRASACGETEVTYTPGSFKGKFVGYAEPDDCGCYTIGTSELECRTSEVGCGPCGESTEVTLRDCLRFVDGEPITYFCGDITLKWSKSKSGCFAR